MMTNHFENLPLSKNVYVKRRGASKKSIKYNSSDFTKEMVIKSQPIFGKRGYSIGHYAQVARADLLVMNAPAKMTFWDRVFPT